MDVLALGLNFRFLNFNDTLREIDANGIIAVAPNTAIIFLIIFALIIVFIKVINRK